MAKICVALDTDVERALEILTSLEGLDLVFKVGPKLFMEGCWKVIEEIKGRGFEVFLDMKWHDIPNTVTLAVETAQKMGVDYATLHTLAGKEVLKSASKRAESLKLLGVTILTSHSEDYLTFLNTSFKSIKEAVLYLADVAKECGLYGVVCSGEEVSEVKERTGLFTVVPGVRIGRDFHDQRRVIDPKEAVDRGADMIVMGRDICKSKEPRAVVEKILEDIS